MDNDPRTSSPDIEPNGSSAGKTVGAVLGLGAGLMLMLNGFLYMRGGGSAVLTLAAVVIAVIGMGLTRASRE